MSTNRLFKVIIAAVLVMVIVFTIREAASTMTVIRTNADNTVLQEMQRARDADAARLNAQAADIIARQTQEAERVQRVREAEAARLNAQAADYFARQMQEATLK